MVWLGAESDTVPEAAALKRSSLTPTFEEKYKSMMLTASVVFIIQYIQLTLNSVTFLSWIAYRQNNKAAAEPSEPEQSD